MAAWMSSTPPANIQAGQDCKIWAIVFTNRIFMSTPSHSHATVPASDADAAHTPDVVESIAHAAPMILPIVGGVLMFLLAFIAVFMA
jgi:hypothetical protein